MMEVRVKGWKRNVTQINTVLIKTKKPMEACPKGIILVVIHEGLDMVANSFIASCKESAPRR